MEFQSKANEDARIAKAQTRLSHTEPSGQFPHVSVGDLDASASNDRDTIDHDHVKAVSPGEIENPILNSVSSDGRLLSNQHIPEVGTEVLGNIRNDLILRCVFFQLTY